MAELTPKPEATTASKGANTDAATPKGGARSNLAGMSYADGAAALSPRVQTKEDPAATPAPTAGADGKTAGAPGPDAKTDPKKEAAIKAKYESLLGSFLGDKLYQLVKDNLSADKLSGYANQGLDAGIKSLGGLLKPIEGSTVLDEASEVAAVNAFAKAVGEWAKPVAEGWLKGADGQALMKNVAGWLEGNPWALVAGALVAAVGAVAANVDIPNIEQKIGLGKGLKLKAGIDLGKIQNLCVQGASLGIEYKKNDFAASLSYKFKNGEDGKADVHTIGAKIGTDTKYLEGTAAVGTDGSLKVNAGGKYKEGNVTASGGATHDKAADGATKTTANVDVTVGTEKKNVSGSAKYDSSTGEVALAAGTMQQFGAWDMAAKASVKTGGADGTSAMGSMSFQHGKDFRAQLEADISQVRGTNLTASAEYKKGNVTAAGSTTFSLTDTQFRSLSLSLGYRDPKEFQAYLLEFKRSYNGKVPEDRLHLMIEEHVNQWMFRVQNTTSLVDGRFNSNVTQGQVGYQVNKDLVLFGGAKYGYESDRGPGNMGAMDRGAWLSVGAQVKGVPLQFSYRPEDRAMTIGITIPFGR